MCSEPFLYLDQYSLILLFLNSFFSDHKKLYSFQNATHKKICKPGHYLLKFWGCLFPIDNRTVELLLEAVAPELLFGWRINPTGLYLVMGGKILALEKQEELWRHSMTPQNRLLSEKSLHGLTLHPASSPTFAILNLALGYLTYVVM